MIGIIGAMGVEIETLKTKLENTQTQTISGIVFYQGKLAGKDVVLAVCGIGKVFAALCAQTMILKYNPSVIINSGVAGTLSPNLSIGDIAVSDYVVQHDMDTTPLGDPPGLLSGLDIVKIPADQKTTNAIVSCAKALGANTEVGTVASGDQFLSDSGVKARIRNTFQAIAGEMEGGAIGHVCYVNRVPFCVLRAISDCADGSGAENYMEFVNTSAKTAADVLYRYVQDFG